MLERARQCGGLAPSALQVVDHLLAALYMRALFGAPGGAFADRLAERLVATARPSRQGR